MRVTWLIKDRLAASGMPYPEDREEIERLGIGAILSLTGRAAGPFPGMVHLHLPVPDMTAPSRETLDRATRFIRDHLSSGKRVLVHCGAGLGRTGTVLACYLVSAGIAPDEAIQIVREARPGSIETYEQEAAILAYPRREGEEP